MNKGRSCLKKLIIPQLVFSNEFALLNSIKNQKNIFYSTKKERIREGRGTDKNLREVWVKIGIEKINIHKEVTIKVLLNSRATR